MYFSFNTQTVEIKLNSRCTDIIITRALASDTGYPATYVDSAYFHVLLCVDEVLCGISQRLCIVVRQSLLVTVEVLAK